MKRGSRKRGVRTPLTPPLWTRLCNVSAILALQNLQHMFELFEHLPQDNAIQYLLRFLFQNVYFQLRLEITTWLLPNPISLMFHIPMAP